MIEIYDAIEPVEREWRELASRLGEPPFFEPGWARAWWQAFGSGTLAVLAVRRNGRLSGVLPVRSRRGVVTSPTNWHTVAYGPVAEDEKARLALFEHLWRDGPRRVDLAFLAAEGESLGALRRATGPYRTTERVIQRSPYVRIAQDWDSYWKTLSKNLRKTVRRCANRLKDHGEVTLEVVDGTEDLDRLLDEGFRLEAKGWKGKRGTAISSSPQTDRFYRGISRWAAERGVLRLAFLRVDGRPVAFNLCIETSEAHYLLKPGHDPELASAGPGTVLTSELVSRAFSMGLDRYEFLGADDRYKLRWTKQCHDLVRVQAFARSVPGAADRLVQTRGRAVAKAVLRR